MFDTMTCDEKRMAVAAVAAAAGAVAGYYTKGTTWGVAGGAGAGLLAWLLYGCDSAASAASKPVVGGAKPTLSSAAKPGASLSFKPMATMSSVVSKAAAKVGIVPAPARVVIAQSGAKTCADASWVYNKALDKCVPDVR